MLGFHVKSLVCHDATMVFVCSHSHCVLVLFLVPGLSLVMLPVASI